MRLTWKLSLTLALGVLVVLVGYAALRVQANVEGFRRDVALGQRDLALAVAQMLESVAAREGEDRARELLAEIAEREAPTRIEWQPFEARSDVVDQIASHVTESAEGPPILESTVAIHIPGERASGLRIVEPLDREAEVERDAMLRIATTSGVVLAICLTLILGFGILFVGRPLEALRRHARRVGSGERGLRTQVNSNDEIGDLAREMNTMAESLDRAADRVQHEQEARLETLAQLRHADRLRTVGELAASVAHDLGTPMGTVSARAQMIANADVDPARARELAASIVEEIERMSKSIRTLLDHGRREGPQLAVTDARSLAQDVLALLAPLAASRRVRLALVDGPDTSAKLDAAQVRHVLINLVTNAIDASPAAQTVELRVSATNERLLLEVDDRGAGIPPDRMDRVFDPFFTTKPKGEGTGLGLSIARGIVQEHGGTLVVSARDGGGSTFVVDLPVDPRDEALGVH